MATKFDFTLPSGEQVSGEHCFPLGDDASKRLIFRAFSPSELSLSDLDDDLFPLVGWLVHQVSLESDTPSDSGEPSHFSATRVVLFGENNQKVACVSEGVAKALAMLRHLYGDGPYNPPIKIRFAKVKTRNKREMHTFDVVE